MRERKLMQCFSSYSSRIQISSLSSSSFFFFCISVFSVGSRWYKIKRKGKPINHRICANVRFNFAQFICVSSGKFGKMTRKKRVEYTTHKGAHYVRWFCRSVKDSIITGEVQKCAEAAGVLMLIEKNCTYNCFRLFPLKSEHFGWILFLCHNLIAFVEEICEIIFDVCCSRGFLNAILCFATPGFFLLVAFCANVYCIVMTINSLLRVMLLVMIKKRCGVAYQISEVGCPEQQRRWQRLLLRWLESALALRSKRQ